MEGGDALAYIAVQNLTLVVSCSDAALDVVVNCTPECVHVVCAVAAVHGDPELTSSCARFLRAVTANDDVEVVSSIVASTSGLRVVGKLLDAPAALVWCAPFAACGVRIILSPSGPGNGFV